MKTSQNQQLGKISVKRLSFLSNLIAFFVFTSTTVLFSCVLSFSGWNILPAGVALGGSSNLLSDWLFWKCAGNTVFWILGIPVAVLLSLWLVVLSGRIRRGMFLFKALYLLPAVFGAIVVYMMWRWMKSPDLALMASFLERAGGSGTGGLVESFCFRPPLMLLGLWIGIGGYSMVLYLGGMQTVNPELYEAAEMDGANGWQKFWSVTWPVLAPVTYSILITGIIAGLYGAFQSAFILRGRSCAGVPGAMSCYYAFRWFKTGYTASIIWLLMIVILIAAFFNYRAGLHTEREGRRC